MDCDDFSYIYVFLDDAKDLSAHSVP